MTAQRLDLDGYMTAPWQVDALVDNLPELGGSVWCPCVGDGSLLRRLQERRPELGPFVTGDIDETKAADCHGDATKAETWAEMLRANDAPDWIVENPPFNVELDILMHAFEAARVGVAFMARVSFCEPTAGNARFPPRGPWLSAHPYQKRITLERYSFTGDGSTDSATTDWLVWSKAPLSGPFGISAYGYKDRPERRPTPCP